MFECALIDADVVLYRIAHTYTHWLHDAPLWSAECLPDARADIDAMVTQITREALCDYSLLCLSDKHSYRKAKVPSYKANRKSSKRPPAELLAVLRAYMTENYDTRVFAFKEADDVMGIISTTNRGECVICTIDKDLDTVPGFHYRWHHPEWGVFKIDPKVAARALRVQILAGDPTDGFKGLPRIGPKKAAAMVDSEDFESVRKCYQEFPGFATVEEADKSFFDNSLCATILQKKHNPFSLKYCPALHSHGACLPSR